MRWVLTLILVVAGVGWGISMPLAKIAVSEGYRHFGLLVWQFAIGAILLGAFTLLRGRRLPLGRDQIRSYVIIAIIGTLIPNSFSYEAARHLPAGVVSIIIAMVPMFAFPIALSMGNDRFSWMKLFGLFLGLLGVALLVGPEASLPERAMAAFIPLALVAPLFYGFEGNYVAKWGIAGLDPVQLLCGASIAGFAMAVPLALFTGQWIDPRPPYAAPDFALMITATLHGAVYCTYVWMVRRAGPVFAAQISYLVTGFGVIWAMILLGESYSNWVWVALGLMLLGLFMVRPREAPVTGDNLDQDVR